MMLKRFPFLFCCFFSLHLMAQTGPAQDSVYLKTITLRVQKIVAPLEITDVEKSTKVLKIIIDQYRKLNDIHTSKADQGKLAREKLGGDKAALELQLKNITNEADAALYHLHFEYLSKLMLFLDDSQIELVKDGMTYGVLPITYKGYCDMVRNLSEEQKKEIKVWLVEAREHAMDAGSADEKHKWFGKYKGRINNYLSAAGFDMKKEGEEWQKRLKEAKGSQVQ